MLKYKKSRRGRIWVFNGFFVLELLNLSSGRRGVHKTIKGVKALFRSTNEASKEMCET
jgi:hypothetical protein